MAVKIKEQNRDPELKEQEEREDMEKDNELTSVEETGVGIYEDEPVAGISMLDTLKNADKKQTALFYTMKAETPEQKKTLYNAINNAEDKVSKHFNEELTISDVAAYPVTLVDEETGEPFEALRVVLIDTVNNKAYAATSQGVVNSLQRLFSIYGMPTWNESLIIIPRQVETKNNRSVTILEVK